MDTLLKDQMHDVRVSLKDAHSDDSEYQTLALEVARLFSHINKTSICLSCIKDSHIAEVIGKAGSIVECPRCKKGVPISHEYTGEDYE